MLNLSFLKKLYRHFKIGNFSQFGLGGGLRSPVSCFCY